MAASSSASPGLPGTVAGSATVDHAGDPKTQELAKKAFLVGAVLGDETLNLFGPTQLQALMHLPLDSAEAVLEVLPKLC